MKKILYIFVLVAIMIILSPSMVSAKTCSGTANISGGLSVPYSYNIVGKNISSGSYQFGNRTYNGVTSAVTMSFSNPNLAKAVANTCFSQSHMNISANIAASFIPQFLQSGRSSWTQPILSCGNTHVYSKTTVVQPINGVCATAKNTCSAGTSNNTGENSSAFTWSCSGSNGGTTAQCSLSKDNGRNGGGNDGDNDESTPEIPANLDLRCKISEPVAIADGKDILIWSAFDGNNPSLSLSGFSWSNSNAGVNFEGNSQASSMTSTKAMQIQSGSVTVSLGNKTATCPGAKFIDGFGLFFNKPIVEPTESCVLNWDSAKIDSSMTCAIYNEQDVNVYDILPNDRSHDVTPNNKYTIKCDTFEPGDDGLPVKSGEVIDEYLSCIRKGTLIEI